MTFSGKYHSDTLMTPTHTCNATPNHNLISKPPLVRYHPTSVFHAFKHKDYPTHSITSHHTQILMFVRLQLFPSSDCYDAGWQGRSTHNCRMEYIWRFVRTHVTDGFRELFHDLHKRNLFNPASPCEMFYLQHVFLPVVQSALDDFRDMWNHHKIRGDRFPFEKISHTLLAWGIHRRLGVSCFICALKVSDSLCRTVEGCGGGIPIVMFYTHPVVSQRVLDDDFEQSR